MARNGAAPRFRHFGRRDPPPVGLKGGLDIVSALPTLLGGLAGGLIAGRIFNKVSVTLLRRVFGLLILYGGIRAVLLL